MLLNSISSSNLYKCSNKNLIRRRENEPKPSTKRSWRRRNTISKDQLEEEDHLKNEKFDPETFFQLRDIDGNGYLDEFEIEAMFQHEV